MRKAYIAGPYRADTEAGVEANIQRAAALARRLWTEGYAVFCPHMNSAHFGGIVPDEAFIRGDLAWLACADVVFATEGWQVSEGARAEIEVAGALGIPVVLPEEEVKVG
ncbi:MAG: DUF4406 domain-containing protein [Pseudomonadota bacterium]